MGDMAVGIGTCTPAGVAPRRMWWLASQHLLLALDRTRTRSLLGFLDGTKLHRGGLNNAHRALAVLNTAIADRAELEPQGGRRLQVLSREGVVDLLRSQSVGRFAYIAREGVPDVVPVNYAWHDDAVLIRSGPGPKLHAAQRGAVVALQVDELDHETRTGVSAVVVGRAGLVDPATVGRDVETWTDGPHRHVIRITPTRVEGRRLA